MDNDYTTVVKIGDVIDFPNPVFAAAQVCKLFRKGISTVYLEAKIKRWARFIIPYPEGKKYLCFFLGNDVRTHHHYKQVDDVTPIVFAEDPVYFVPHLVYLTGETRQNFWWWARNPLKGEIKNISKNGTFVRKEAWDKFWNERQKHKKVNK